jgi:hypothetical protein
MTAIKNQLSRPTPDHRWLALALALAIPLAGGVLYGNYSQRWNKPAESVAAATALKSLPREVGRWKAAEDLVIEPAALQQLDCAGYVYRRYVNQDSGQSIKMVIVAGPPGPIAVHTPEICFSSRAYDIQNERTAVSLERSPGRPHSFWMVDFVTRNAFADRLRVYYAWSLGETWAASRSPRFSYAGAPLLYKIQVAATVPPRSSDESADSVRQFVEQLLDSGWKHSAIS